MSAANSIPVTVTPHFSGGFLATLGRLTGIGANRTEAVTDLRSKVERTLSIREVPIFVPSAHDPRLLYVAYPSQYGYMLESVDLDRVVSRDLEAWTKGELRTATMSAVPAGMTDRRAVVAYIMERDAHRAQRRQEEQEQSED